MGKLTTHVLDTLSGEPARGVLVKLYRGEDLIVETVTNAEGRCDSPLLQETEPGIYRIVFSIGKYFSSSGVESPFLDEIPVQFTIGDERNYHVPLVCSPFSYSTYRGS